MFTLDHVVYAGADQERLVSRFADAGLTPEFGGVHDHGTTQMSVLGFSDGSYLELLGPTPETAPETAVFWPDHLAADAGPTAWCRLVDDVAESTVSHVRAGVPADGPHHRGRERPDGTAIEWDMAFFGEPDAKLALPFVIADRTPRRYRVTPTEEHADGPLCGVAEVVLGVGDVEAWAARFADYYRTPRPVDFTHPEATGVLADIPGTPVSLLEVAGGGPIGARRRETGLPDGPVAFLLGTDDLDAASDAYTLTETAPWHGRRLAWVDGLEGEVGVVEPPADGPVSAGPNAE